MCDEPSINLELYITISPSTSKTMHELTNAIIKNKKSYEKIAVVEIIFEFIEKILQNHLVI